MKLTTEELKNLIDKRIILFTSKGFTYNCKVISIGEDYIKIIDKYSKIHFISLDYIESLEEQDG